jgi:hypothetical protein
MPNTTKDRSQPLLRVPRDQTPVVLLLDDGQRANAFLFVPPGTSILHTLENSGPFIPVSYSDGTRLVARASIACINVYGSRDENELPGEQQRVVVRLRSGQLIKGELRWVAHTGYRRVLDHLNDASTHVVLHDADRINYIAKGHIMTIEESSC